MAPLLTMLAYVAACVWLWVSVSKLGRAGWAYAIPSLLAGMPFAMMMDHWGANGFFTAVLTFCIPAGMFFYADSKGPLVRPCPHCESKISLTATACRHCGSMI